MIQSRLTANINQAELNEIMDQQQRQKQICISPQNFEIGGHQSPFNTSMLTEETIPKGVNRSDFIQQQKEDVQMLKKLDQLKHETSSRVAMRDKVIRQYLTRLSCERNQSQQSANYPDISVDDVYIEDNSLNLISSGIQSFQPPIGGPKHYRSTSRGSTKTGKIGKKLSINRKRLKSQFQNISSTRNYLEHFNAFESG